MFEDNRFVGRLMQQGAYAFVVGRWWLARRIPKGFVEIARQRHGNRRLHKELRSSVREGPLTNAFECMCAPGVYGLHSEGDIPLLLSQQHETK